MQATTRRAIGETLTSGVAPGEAAKRPSRGVDASEARQPEDTAVGVSTHAGRIVAAMRIVVDMTPLSLEQTGIPNYLSGMVRGLVETGGDHSIVAFAPSGPRGSRRVAAALSDLPIEKRILSVPGAYYWRALWSRLGRLPVERFVGRLDVFQF